MQIDVLFLKKAYPVLESYDRGALLPLFHQLVNKMLCRINDAGYFSITDIYQRFDAMLHGEGPRLLVKNGYIITMIISRQDIQGIPMIEGIAFYSKAKGAETATALFDEIEDYLSQQEADVQQFVHPKQS